jgi:hypothetical protein
VRSLNDARISHLFSLRSRVSFSQELRKERAGCERVSADLKALLAFEIKAKNRFEQDLDKQKFESAESQKQLFKVHNAFNSNVCDALDARAAATQSKHWLKRC